MEIKNDIVPSDSSTWTKPRLLVLITTAYYDLFSEKGYKPTANELRLWLNKYIRKETFKKKSTKKTKDVPIQGKNN